MDGCPLHGRRHGRERRRQSRGRRGREVQGALEVLRPVRQRQRHEVHELRRSRVADVIGRLDGVLDVEQLDEKLVEGFRPIASPMVAHTLHRLAYASLNVFESIEPRRH